VVIPKTPNGQDSVAEIRQELLTGTSEGDS
jgi:hypothetical protein